MPLAFIRELDNQTRLGLWKIEEINDDLKKLVNLEPNEEIQYASFKSEIRKKQWLGYRLLLKKILSPFPSILEYDIFGKPFIKNSDQFISISHSGEYAAVIVSKTTPVGIDIEQLKDRIHRIKDKFLSPEEDLHIGDENRLEKLYIAWGAKEALYKIHGKSEVEFQRDIFIESFDYLCSGLGNCHARMITPEGYGDYDVYYQKIDNYMLVFALKQMGEI
jgi:4'-phosphopantetheinyl transferase